MTSDLSPAFQTLADLLDPPVDPYVDDPVAWVEDRLDEFLWSKQREVMEAVRDHRYVAVKSAHDTGKSHLASRLVAWWLATHTDPFVTTTAPTAKQVHAVLWRYIGQARRKANLDGRITLDDEWYAGPGGKELVGFGRKPADTDQAAFQGIHALNPMIIVDEACGVPSSIFDAVDALATNSNARVLAIGNPDDPASHFANICKPGSGWHVIKISAFDTPAWTGEKVPDWLYPLLIDPVWVDERKKRWGEGSPIYQSKVLGEFPDISDDSLIMPKWIEAAQLRELSQNYKPHLGVDVARFGEDESIIFRREGGWARVQESFSKADTMTTTGRVIQAQQLVDGESHYQDNAQLTVDEVGVGAGVVDRLRELGYKVNGFNGGRTPTDTDRFVNLRAEMFWMLREMFEKGEIDIDEKDDQLAAQLGSIKWAPDSRGRIKIESKDDIRKRGLPSPDRADALSMTLYDRSELWEETVVVDDRLFGRR